MAVLSSLTWGPHGTLASLAADLPWQPRYPLGPRPARCAILPWRARATGGRHHLHGHLHAGHVVGHALCRDTEVVSTLLTTTGLGLEGTVWFGSTSSTARYGTNVFKTQLQETSRPGYSISRTTLNGLTTSYHRHPPPPILSKTFIQFYCNLLTKVS